MIDERLDAFARAALAAYDLPDGTEASLLNISENATFKVTDPTGGDPTVLRLHRPGYHSKAAIESELAWVSALNEAGLVRTAGILPAADGRRVVTAGLPDGEERFAVRFAWINGVEPSGTRLVDDFATLGAITARLHAHTKTWQPPAGFIRHRWDFSTSIGSQGHWGQWRDGLGVSPDVAEQLARLESVLERRLKAYGTSAERFGLVHADMRIANLLVSPAGPGAASDVHVIDFDDCGFSWFMYDLGASLSFIEDDPRVPELIDAWVRGYRTVSVLSTEDEAELPTFVMLRRLLLVAWIGSHAETETAQQMGPDYAFVTCDLAETYLSRPAHS